MSDYLSLASLTSRIEAETGITMPDFKDMPKDELFDLVKNLKHSGQRMADIARLIGVSRKTAYNYLYKAHQSVIDELETKKYIDIYTEQLDELEARRDKYLREAMIIQDSGRREDVDPVTGVKTVRQGYTRDYIELMRLVRDYDKLIIDLKKSVGFIPVQNPDQIYGRISEKNPETHENSDEDILEMNTPELQQLLLKKLQGKAPPLGGNALKAVADQQIL